MLRAVMGGKTEGNEIWSFIPSLFLNKLKGLRDNAPGVTFPAPVPATDFNKPYMIDGSLSLYAPDEDANCKPDKAWLFLTMRRAWAEEKAGNLQKADVYTTLFILQRLRLGHSEESFEESDQLQSEIAELCREAISIFGATTRLNAQSRLSEALLELARWPSYLPSELMAEQVYLECELLLKQTDYAARREALNKLEAYTIFLQP